MRRKQWFFSAFLFAASLCFLIFSKNFFSSTPVSQRMSLPATSIPRSDVILLANKDYYPFLNEHFRKAQKNIIGTVYLFRTAPFRGNEPAELLRELIVAQKRNVLVELVMELSSDDKDNEANLHASEALRKAGVRVRLDRRDVATHAKAFVIDDRYCFVGSHNFTHSAMAINRELSLFIDSPEMAREITEFIRQIPLSGLEVLSSEEVVNQLQ